MRMKSLVLIFIALGCGLVASIGISQALNGKGGGAQVEMESILVTLTEIDINAEFNANNVKLEPWPKIKLPEGAVRSLEEVKDKYAAQRFVKGEPILLDKIMDSKNGVAQAVPPGFRVFTVKVDEESVMRGLAPGDRIDINLYVKRSEEISEPGTYTIMQAVRVFSVGAKISKDSDPKATENQFRTISLLVTPEQVRHLAGAVQIGKLSFTLRNPNEPIDDDGEGVTPLPDILKGGAVASGEEGPSPVAPQPAVVQAPVAPATPPGGSLLEMFAGGLKTISNMKPPEVAAEPSTGYTMHIYTNTDVKQYQWQDRNGMPQESTIFSTGAAGPSSSPAPAPAAGAGVNHRPGYLLERRPSWMTETAR